MKKIGALVFSTDHTPINNENEIPETLLPEKLFINIIDIELQKKIENTEGIDQDAIEAMKTLLEEGTPNVMNWTNIYIILLFFHLYTSPYL